MATDWIIAKRIYVLSRMERMSVIRHINHSGVYVTFHRGDGKPIS